MTVLVIYMLIGFHAAFHILSKDNYGFDVGSYNKGSYPRVILTACFYLGMGVLWPLFVGYTPYLYLTGRSKSDEGKVKIK